ncbi:MAG TPA: site-specific integrase [Azospirillum sp.]|nr:site-specific integrase [Azospirillum sp.]
MTYLRKHPKTAVWYFRRTIPKPIRPYVGRGSDWYESLGTKDLAEAKKRAKPVGQRADTAFDEGWAKLKAETSGIQVDAGEWIAPFAGWGLDPFPVLIFDTLTLTDAETMAQQWARDQVRRFQEVVAAEGVPVDPVPVYGPVPPPPPAWGMPAGHPLQIAIARQLNWPRDPRLPLEVLIVRPDLDDVPAERVVWEIARRYQINLEPGGQSWRYLRNAVLRAEKAVRGEVERIKAGDWTLPLDTPPQASVSRPGVAPYGPKVESLPESSAGGPSIRTVWDSYVAREKPSIKTADEFRAAWDLFFAAGFGFIWDSPLAQIDRQTVRVFRDLLQRLPSNGMKSAAYRGLTLQEIAAKVGDNPNVPKQKAATVNKKLSALRVVFNHAIAEFDLTVNPVALLSVNVDDSEDGEPFSTAELVKIFTSDRITTGRWNADYWLPVLALYTGARVNELGQLYLDDIRNERGVDYLDINANTPDKSLKNVESARKVPIHPELVKLGFLTFVARQRKADTTRLFPELEYVPGAGYTKNFSRDFGRFREKLGIIGKGKKFHSFRHSFKDAAREAEIPKPIYDTLQGHAESRNVGSSYGKGYSLSRLAEAMKRIEYPGVVVPRVNP